jgi:hypothetical protein
MPTEPIIIIIMLNFIYKMRVNQLVRKFLAFTGTETYTILLPEFWTLSIALCFI